MTGIKLKQLGLVTLIVGGLCVQAFAQSPTLSAPAVPALPPLPTLPAQSSNTPPALPDINLPASPASPSLAALPIVPQAPVPTNAPSPNDPSFTPAKLPELEVVKNPPAVTPATVDAPAEVLSPEAAEAAAAEKASGVTAEVGANTTSNLPPQGLPELPLPGASNQNPPIANVDLPAISLPEIEVDQQVVKPKPKIITWQTKLAPSIIPPNTNFNYKRAQLPDVIYRTQYSPDNRHLPTRVTRDDYENLLFTSVTRNDIETTRALLNAGTGIQATNAAGETPLAAAKRAGAVDVAALLIARGAR